MRLSSMRQLVVLWTLSALGCGGVTAAVTPDAGGTDVASPSDDGAGGDTAGMEGKIAEACAAVAQAACDKRVACSGKINPAGVGIIRLFGSMNECLARQALQCTSAFRAPGSGHSLATEAECAAAFANYSCADFFANGAPAACQPQGARINGASCAFNAQCKSGFCTGEGHALCGTCAPEPAVGDSCAATDCGRGQVCDATSKTCRTPGAVGDPCDSNDDCGYGFVCNGNGGAGGAGTCQMAASMVGAACGGMMPVCDGVQGLFCAGAMGAKKCVTTTFVGDGAPCGVLSQDSFAGCTAGACYAAKGLAGPGEMGTCKANAADGAACDAATGPQCEFPARCVLGNGTGGVCRVPAGQCN
jgi:hypothetical protein